MSPAARAFAHLQDVFPSIPASAVSAALSEAEGDSDKAAAALLDYTSGPREVPRQVTVDSLCQSPILIRSEPGLECPVKPALPCIRWFFELCIADRGLRGMHRVTLSLSVQCSRGCSRGSGSQLL